MVLTFLESNDIKEPLRSELVGDMPSRPQLPGLGLNTWSSYFIRVLDESARSRDKTIWMEKTPENVRRINLISKYAPRAVFIHLIRNGGDTVASLVKAWPDFYDIPKAVRRWNDNLRHSWKRLSAGKDLAIHYDAITQDTEAAMKKLFEKLGLTFDPAWLQTYKVNLATVIAPWETWQQNASEPISRRGAFGDTFSAEEQRQVLDSLNNPLYERIQSLIQVHL